MGHELGTWLDPRALAGVAYLAVVSLPLCRIDLRERRLPNALVLPGYAFAAIGVGWPALAWGNPPDAYVELLLCWAATVAVLLVAASGGGLGMGDVKLAGLLALVLGGLAAGRGLSPALPMVSSLGLAFVAAGLAAATTTLRRRALPDDLPLGPFLLAAFWVAATVVPVPVPVP